jgi:hypothetical protein
LTTQRLSKLQRWILKTIQERGTDAEIGRYIFRRELVRSFFAQSSGVNNKEVRKRQAAKANVSLTRSIKNLHAKGLVKIFVAYRTRYYFRTGLGKAQRVDASRAKHLRAMKRLEAYVKHVPADTSEEDAVLSEYKLRKHMARDGAIIPREITGAPDDFDMMDLEFSRALRIQIVALTEKGKRAAPKKAPGGNHACLCHL